MRLRKRLFDPATFSEDFPGGFISLIGKDGHLPYQLKCIFGLGILPYVVGLVIASLSNTLFPDPWRGLATGYLRDIYIPTLSLVTGFTALFAIRALRGLGDKLVHTDRALFDRLDEHTNEEIGIARAYEKLEKLEKRINNESWIKYGKLYYVLCSSFSTLGLGIGYLSVMSRTDSWNSIQFWACSGFFIGLCVVVGLTVGSLIFIAAKGIYTVRKYCKDEVSLDLVWPLNPDKLGGLAEIGRFSWELDAAAAIPGLAFFVSYFYSGTQILSPSSIPALATYTGVWICVLFLPLLPFHAIMANAKRRAVNEVDGMYRGVCSKILSEDEALKDPKVIRELRHIHYLHAKITKRPAWPLNLDLSLKFIGTLTVPIIASLISSVFTKLLGS